ncbi:MAG TPA: hypothetical protein VGR02_05485 [Thermoanaerobaculia bacterium]|jgi:hypothetical protein|nr:hypothetical protein [Thermoanaerobaculia bacterium]
MAKRIRLFVLVAMLIVGAVSLVAAPDHAFYVTYYTDDTYTVECGYWYYTCFGSPQRSGCRTAYSIYEDWGDC